MSISFSEIIKGIFKNGLGYKVLVWQDKENPDYTNYQMRGNFVNKLSASIGTGGNIDFAADAFISSKEEVNLYSLILKCNVENGLFVRPDDSLTLVIDSAAFKLSFDPSFSKENEINNFGNYYLIEAHRFLVEKEFLKLIADSRDVNIIIHGQEKDIEGELTQKNIRRFREFYYNYLQKTTDEEDDEYECSECHISVNKEDKICPGCGAKLEN